MKTILIVDDDIVSRKVMKNICERLGYHVLESDNGEKALKIMKKKKVEILISDWIMPKLDGVTLCARVRANSAGASPFVFLITGKKKGLSNYAEAMNAGADDFVYKPVDFYVFRNQLQVAERALALAN